MCIIVAANAAGDLASRTVDGLPVLRWLLKSKRSGLVVGGRLQRELADGGLRETLRVLDQAGRLRRIGNDHIQTIEDGLRSSRECVSNDHHVLALVIASSCYLVFTKDQKLHQDLKNRRIVGRRAQIYQTAQHALLLKKCDCRGEAD
ncbi:MAG: hypothetical protein ACP5NP_03895 [Acetobacteraceae bacterium]